ncbi:AraC family transcriptional regulator [Flavihumibacter sp. CACIAM 22H1]|uniref:AraC family transcriptional regulator n=1 Tax=Flavihumibacter sp. CACIAM 22H1 TaxID=1812911 RepID=UPI0007A8B9D8|nr:AraC family transcriptional regulator [Flavihumibacter sp. CACIAM 22H1]KYP16599.1 MAG: hypothetical protein A1D16_09295 [Flavihumibacter sp. CACIAM 22H1]
MAYKIEKTSITPRTNSMACLITRNQSFFESVFHTHPELELVYILESSGKRIIGNTIETFEPGDMVFIGANTPHLWTNNEEYLVGNTALRAKAMVVYFNPALLHEHFYQQQENISLSILMANSVKGLKITGPTKEIIAQKLVGLEGKTGIEVLVGIIDILALLSTSKDTIPINKELIQKTIKNHINDRIPEILNYVTNNYMNDLSLETMAQQINMTRQSFCRFFKTKMKQNFLDYVNEVRIQNACRLLMETDLAIFEIAYECGYKTVSNFNKVFKELKEITPVKFRQQTQIKI